MKRQALLFALVLAPLAARAADGPQPTLPTQKLTVVSKSGVRHEFTVELATTPQEQEVGARIFPPIAACSSIGVRRARCRCG
jgi:hypothetical protein